MRRLCDLHSHSTASDGTASPAELVALAERAGLGGLALTDHDTLGGLGQAARAAERLPELTFVPGVEVSAVPPQGTLHILGLAIDPACPALAAMLSRLRAARDERNVLMTARLRELGLDVTMEDVRAVARRAAEPGEPLVVGRLHMAEVLLAKGRVRSLREAFDRYLGTGAPAYVDKERLTPAEVCDAIHRAGGLALLAHPVQLDLRNFAQAEGLIRRLVEQGLDGLEVYHSDHSDAQTRFFLDLARRFDWAVSGGSDFHGAVKPQVRLGRPRVPLAVMEDLLARAARRR